MLNLSLFSSGVFLEINLQEKTEISDYIIEGQVLNQESFWDSEHNQILTAYEILVYKSFKNELPSDHIFVIVEGGIVGDEMHRVFPDFNSKVGDLGVFFLTNNSATKNWSAQPSDLQFRPISNNQGKLAYDLINGLVVDNEKIYSNINKEVYQVIAKNTQKEYTVWNDWTMKSDKETPKDLPQLLKTVNGNVECLYPNVIIAGNNAVLSITGTGFGTQGFNSSVRMRNPDTGGQSDKKIDNDHILYWDDSTIEIIIPDNVGTGVVTIMTNSGETIVSEMEVMVSFAVNTSGSDDTPSMLVGQNQSNGYDFYYSSNTSFGGVSFAGSAGEAPFERAIERLQQEVGFNAQVAGTSDIHSVSNDGYNLIMFDNNDEVLTSAGLLHAQYSRCGGMWEVVGLDIVFRRTGTGSPILNWNYSTATPNWNELDFESVAIHELIHGLQIKHNLQEPSLMYFAYSFGQQKRELHNCYDKAAIEIVNNRSMEYIPYCEGNSSYALHPSFQSYNYDNSSCIAATDCGENANPGIPRVNARLLLGGFSTNAETMNNMLAYSNLLPNEQPFNQDPWNYQGTETVTDFPNITVDWVLVALRDSSDPDVVVATKAALLDFNGNLIDLDGEQGIAFSEVAEGNYYLSIQHCSHLGVLSNELIAFPNKDSYDFTTSVTQAMGPNQLELKYGVYTLIPGDYDGNGIINNLDFNKWVLQSAVINQYVSWDGDGNGVVNNIDYNLWSKNSSKIGIQYLTN